MLGTTQTRAHTLAYTHSHTKFYSKQWQWHWTLVAVFNKFSDCWCDLWWLLLESFQTIICVWDFIVLFSSLSYVSLIYGSSFSDSTSSLYSVTFDSSSFVGVRCSSSIRSLWSRSSSNMNIYFSKIYISIYIYVYFYIYIGYVSNIRTKWNGHHTQSQYDDVDDDVETFYCVHISSLYINTP